LKGSKGLGFEVKFSPVKGVVAHLFEYAFEICRTFPFWGVSWI